MINIKELTPHKIPGKTSLFVTTPYNPDVVKALKACAPFSYTKKDNIWEIPTTRLAKFVNEVSGIDDICIELKPEKKSLPVEDIKLFTHKTKPYPYQEEGIKYGLTHNKWLLLDAPGLGKTLQMIYLAEELKKREGIKHCLIVCGLNTLKTNWEKEIQKHSTLSCRILGKKVTKKGTVNFGSIPERLSELKKPLKEFFLIVNIETLRNDDIIKELTKGKNSYDMIVFDEIHTCFVGNTLVNIDNKIYTIEDVVEKGLGNNILGYDLETGHNVYKPIEGRHKYDYFGKMVTFTIQREDGKTIQMKVTPEHLIFTHNRGFVKAIDITEEDTLEINCI